MPKFEAHITMDKSAAPRVKPGVGNWQYSAIDDDPIMGQKPYCYLTAYSPNATDLKADMEEVCMGLTLAGVLVLRTKIERIIFDSKTGVNELDAVPAAV